MNRLVRCFDERTRWKHQKTKRKTKMLNRCLNVVLAAGLAVAIMAVPAGIANAKENVGTRVEGLTVKPKLPPVINVPAPVRPGKPIGLVLPPKPIGVILPPKPIGVILPPKPIGVILPPKPIGVI